MSVLQTARLSLHEFTTDDAEFVRGLLNDPSFLRFIGDRHVRTLDDARRYLVAGPIASYARHGFGLYLVRLRASATPIGMCGLLKRDTLDDVDVGFAFMPEFRGQGYAREAASAVMDLARTAHGLSRVVAIVSPDNVASIALLRSLGFGHPFGRRYGPGADPRLLLGADTGPALLFGCNLDRLDAARRRGWLGSLALTLARLALAPAIIAAAIHEARGWILAAMLLAGFVSDILDGVVARRYGAITPFLRRLDSVADTIFYLATAYAAWTLHPASLRELAWPIAVVIAGEATNFLVAFLKFHREASYHAWSAKVWGALLFSALMALFGTGSAAMLPVALLSGIIAQCESLAITAVLPIWHHDVPSVWHAWRLRESSVVPS